MENRLLSITTPLKEDELVLIGVRGTETLSEGFRFDVDLYSTNLNIDFKKIVGESVTLHIHSENEDQTRYINGIVSLFEQGNRPEGMDSLPNINYYYARVVPWTWLLTQRKNYRIFQEKTVKDIVDAVFEAGGYKDYEWQIDAPYTQRTYCVQYNETDFNFVSRLLEEEGIYYYFRHEEKTHTMVLVDSMDRHGKCPSNDTAAYHDGTSRNLTRQVITNLKKTIRVTPTKYTLKDYNFTTPNSPLLTEMETAHPDNVKKSELEIFDYPGLYEKTENGDHLCKVRMEQSESAITTVFGSSYCRGFLPGYTFMLQGYQFREDMNDKEYLLSTVTHETRQPYEPAGIKQEVFYENRFECIPKEVPFRPLRKSSKPLIPGVQTAIVVGALGYGEPDPDEYGRVKVQFHWDRADKKDDTSSCWIRVRQDLAGVRWVGGVHTAHRPGGDRGVSRRRSGPPPDHRLCIP